ncbi:MAG: response regulator [Stellaceae bacterium]
MADTSKPITILIVEDDALIAAYLTELMVKLGFVAVGTAASGVEALALAAATRPNLALVDIGLLGSIDGVDLAVRLKAEHGVPAIFVSGDFNPETALRAQRAQPLGLVQKPFLPSELLNAIERAQATIGG